MPRYKKGILSPPRKKRKNTAQDQPLPSTSTEEEPEPVWSLMRDLREGRKKCLIQSNIQPQVAYVKYIYDYKHDNKKSDSYTVPKKLSNEEPFRPAVPFAEVDCKWEKPQNLSEEDQAKWKHLQNLLKLATFKAYKENHKCIEWSIVKRPDPEECKLKYRDLNDSDRSLVDAVQIGLNFGMGNGDGCEFVEHIIEACKEFLDLKTKDKVIIAKICGTFPADKLGFMCYDLGDTLLDLSRGSPSVHSEEFDTSPCPSDASSGSSTPNRLSDESVSEETKGFAGKRQADICVFGYNGKELWTVLVVEVKGIACEDRVDFRSRKQIMQQMIGVLSEQLEVFGLLLYANRAVILRMRKNTETKEIALSYDECSFEKYDKCSSYTPIPEGPLTVHFDIDDFLVLIKKLMAVLLYGSKNIRRTETKADPE